MAKSYSGPGQPSKLTEETKKGLYEGIELGLSYKLACERVNIHYTTFRKWIAKGEKQKSGEYFDFVEGLKEKQATGAAKMLMNIRRSGNEGHWQADAWILERRHAEDFGRREKHEVTGKDGGPVRQEVEHSGDTTDNKRAREFDNLFAQLHAYRTGYNDRDSEGDRGQPVHPGSSDDPSTEVP